MAKATSITTIGTREVSDFLNVTEFKLRTVLRSTKLMADRPTKRYSFKGVKDPIVAKLKEAIANMKTVTPKADKPSKKDKKVEGKSSTKSSKKGKKGKKSKKSNK